MRGHIRKRSKDSWTIVVDLGRNADGKRNQKWHSVKGTKREAEAELVRILKSTEDGIYIEPNKTSVNEYLKEWLKTIESKVARKTHERYSEICDHYVKPHIGHLKLNKVQPTHINTFYSDLLISGRRDKKSGLSKRTVLHTHRVLRGALNRAVKWQILVRNPCDAVDPPKPDKKERLTFTTKETIELLEKAKGIPLHLPIMLAVTTGMRRGEIIGLRWKDINLESGNLSIRQVAEQTKKHGLHIKEPKTDKSTRMVSLPKMTTDALKQHKVEQSQIFLQLGKRLDSDSMVFDSPLGLYPPNKLTTDYMAFIKRNKFKHVTFHDLRHTHATHLLEQNIHPKIVSERLGHSTVSLTLDTYSHVMPNMQEGAANVTDKILQSNKS